jgi:uncharacterized protein DUF6894
MRLCTSINGPIRPAYSLLSKPTVTQYFLDLRSATTVSQDTEGIQLPDVETAHDMALGRACDAVTEGS